MSLAQYPRQVVFIFIAILLAQCSFTQATEVKCLGGFNLNSDPATAMCSDKEFKPWKCPTAKCKKDGQPHLSMSGCLHNGVAGSGISDQKCAQYNTQPVPSYGCMNPGGQVYVCPFKATDPPYLTCSDCTKPVESTARQINNSNM
ncbi:uncharacterized protein MELLADRAFT_113834 [Melampsora larici-populina 98AG31]|uniref:Secreted protein n=1 Tax=Melampsora larici-populina (strain 98AG31 / pathotype 3-4-7) TaxID=747676 RepID=F4SB71_MELLP|nr:uncharacterized protein MELLADRAFT_113834 [Melampsora larici-populina 98AG31]EGF98097.1 secreted protein [Melampsora larici-populina 98AG31]